MINSRQTEQLDPGPAGEPVHQKPAQSMRDVLPVADPRNSEDLGSSRRTKVFLRLLGHKHQFSTIIVMLT